MMRLEGRSIGELGRGFDLELLEAVRAAATPEEQLSADEAISVVTDTLRSNRVAVRGTVARKAASRGRRRSARVGAAFVVTLFSASASLAISGQLPSGARDIAAAFLAQIGLFPGQRVEASGPVAASHTTGEPFGPVHARDGRFIWVHEFKGDDGTVPAPVHPPVEPPHVQDPPPVEDPPPPPVEDPPPPPVEDPPPPPVEDPPPPVEDPPPPPVEDPPPPVENPPPVDPPVENPPPVDPPVENPPPVDPPVENPPPVDPPVENPPPV